MKWLIFIVAFFALITALAYLLYFPQPGMQARPALGEQREIDRNGRRLIYYVQGSGPRVALAASAGREVSDFNELTRSLVAAGYRTLAIEAPGINGVSMPIDNANLYDLAADVKAIIDADSFNEAQAGVVVIGHAFGNRVMRATASRYPDLVRGTILIAAGGKRAVPEKADLALKNCFNPLRTAAQRLDDIGYGFFASGNPIPDYWRRGWHTQTAIMQGKASRATPDKNWLAAGTAPILIIQAVQDRIAPKQDAADELQMDLGDRVSVVLIDPAGHALLPEQPQQIAKAVLAFLARLSR